MLEFNKIYLGDNIELLKQLEPNSVHSCVSDFPYNLGFMGKKWDTISNYYDWCKLRAEGIYNALKPGGYCLIFGGTRTHHRLVCAFEDVGFEIRDEIQWIYGSGFPKSMDISKAIDKNVGRIDKNILKLKYKLIELVKSSGKTGSQIDNECGFRAMNYLTLPKEGKKPDPWVNILPSIDKWLIIKNTIGCNEDISNELDEIFSEAEREIIGQQTKARSEDGKSALPTMGAKVKYETWNITSPATDLAKQWDGFGTALKPAHEPIMVARKPLSEKTVAQNVLKWGTGGINIDDSRIETTENLNGGAYSGNIHNKNEDSNWQNSDRTEGKGSGFKGGVGEFIQPQGRFPANIIFDEEAGKILDEQTGILKSGDNCTRTKVGSFLEHGGLGRAGDIQKTYGDKGGASRFFYCAKASKKDRTENNQIENKHPTVKPTDLIKYLVRLVTPKNGICLDVCEGSGTHIKACLQLTKEDYPIQYIGFENDEESFNMSLNRESLNNII